ncbi:hypothetical protein HYFRA_00006546 [Hymenoscyphus fraxineus]|uniref:Methyltransferase FkbM domain-containing protein n=1 Tax=Hymenoscyphus fraxineus TaxID=746836 RepID=A0A9N9KVI7_9HELO|nr:hypothetical protein HYFRA_00006546 [Hymenoscyphus fraxineus]
MNQALNPTEQEILERTNCEIWGYDYSVDEFGPQLLPEYLPRTHFLRAAIGATTDPKSSPPSYSIQDLMKENGHDYIDILKIDIEYAEFNVLSSLNAYTLDVGTEMPIGQMLMELHLFSTQGITLPIFMDWWESMENRGFRPSWTEPNLLSVTLGIDDRMPRLTEYTFLNVKDINNKLFT